MRVSELLTAIASWLESPENEALMLAEYDDKCLEAVAETCCAAAEILRMGAEQADLIEPPTETSLTPEKLDHLNSIISAFDRSGDADLKKTADVMDDLLLTLASPPDWASNYKLTEWNRLEALKQTYDDTRKQTHELAGVKESAKAIDKSPMFKEVRIMDHALKTRTCPDHAGAQMARVGENQYQCSLDGKVFNYSNGYTTERGEHVPGESVSAQTPTEWPQPMSMFDTREDRQMGRIPDSFPTHK